MNTNKENDPRYQNAPGESGPNDEKFKDLENKHSFLTDKKDNTEIKSDDDRPIQNADQEGFGMDDGPNQPLSKEMLNDLQDAGQRDLQRQREEKRAKKQKEE